MHFTRPLTPGDILKYHYIAYQPDIFLKVIELSELNRFVFHLRDVERLSDEEVSKISDLSIAAVKSILRKVRIYLRDKLHSKCFYE